MMEQPRLPFSTCPADIAVSSLVCPTNHTSGSENQIIWELVSLRGEAFSTSIIYLDLIDSAVLKLYEWYQRPLLSMESTTLYLAQVGILRNSR